MKGLIVKDLLGLKTYFKQVCFIYVFYLVFCLMGFWDITFFVSIATMMGALMFISTMSYDEMSKWDAFALSTPVTRKDLVRSKFLLLLLTLLGSAAASLLIGVLMQAFQGKLAFLELAASVGAVAVVAMTGVSITLFIAFKLGIEKARLAMITVFVLPTLLIFMVTRGADKLGISFSIAELERFFPLLAAAAVVVAILVIGLMYALSVWAVEKKEF